MAGAHHARVDGEGGAQLVVRLCRGVVAQDKVVALAKGLLELARLGGKAKDAPVRDAADDAALAEDCLAGG